jgi:hypothetical protein
VLAAAGFWMGLWRIELTWAAISLATHGALPLQTAVVYVLKDSGPNWAEQLTAWATLGATLGIGLALAGALVARGQLKEAKKDRYSQRIMEMFRAWDEDDLIATRRLLTGLSPEQFKDLYFWERKRNSKQFYEFLKLGNYFEIFGILEEQDGLTITMIDTVLGSTIISYWKQWSRIVEAEQAAQELGGHPPTFYTNWGRLAGKLRERHTLDGSNAT